MKSPASSTVSRTSWRSGSVRRRRRWRRAGKPPGVRGRRAGASCEDRGKLWCEGVPELIWLLLRSAGQMLLLLKWKQDQGHEGSHRWNHVQQGLNAVIGRLGMNQTGHTIDAESNAD